MEQACKCCGVMKAGGEYERTGSGGYRTTCRECRRTQSARHYRETRSVKAGNWSEFADEVIVERYPMGGAAACLPFLPDRSIAAIQQRAFRLGAKLGVHESAEQPWPLPQQDSAPMHLLFQRTRVPVFGAALVASV